LINVLGHTISGGTHYLGRKLSCLSGIDDFLLLLAHSKRKNSVVNKLEIWKRKIFCLPALRDAANRP
jgi:hypothetical protein